jgi:quercetin dioxygenase-like cupin family protein
MNAIPKHLGNSKANRCRCAKIPPRSRFLELVSIGAVLLLSPILPASADDAAKVSELMTKDLASVPGKEVTMITVEYPPGAADPVHRHNASAFIYVLEGSIEMQMKGGEKVTLYPGETFYEDPAGIHLVGKNASNTKPAKFLVVLVKDKGAPILIPAHE